MAYLYRHIRLDKNEVFYVGIGLEDRYCCRSYRKTQRNKFWTNIINKTDYEIEIVLDDLTWEEACQKEIEFIKLYGRRDKSLGTLVNLTDGGEGGTNHVTSEATKIKLRNHNLGKIVSDETRVKISDAIKKLPKSLFTPERREGISKRNRLGGNGGARLVLNLETGIFYDTILEAAYAYGLGYSCLYHYLHGRTKNKTSLVFI